MNRAAVHRQKAAAFDAPMLHVKSTGSPSAWASARRAETDDAVCGYRLDEGAMVVIAQWVTQRESR